EQLKQAKGDGGGGYTFAPPKRKSKRDVPLPADILPDLKRHKAEQAKHRLALGPGYYREKDLIVCLSDGRPWQPDNFSSDFAEFLTKAGLPHMRFHDLRHTYATKLLEAGVDIKTVSEHLGHTSIKVTADKYGHVTPRMKDRSAETMGQILARIRDHQNRRKGETDDRDSAAEK
ncbi:MAG: site-specific integrase, partial [Peptococcaceae bacterium]|nr:site-specific integrase [Peptococcaceae bacterium]